MITRTSTIIPGILLALAACLNAAASGRPASPPGEWAFEPARLIAGQETLLELRYRQGACPLPARAYFRFELEGLSVQALPFGPISTGLRLIPGAGTHSEIEVTSGPVGGLAQREVKLRFPKGLRSGESFALRIGNPAAGGELRARVNPIPVHGLSFDIESGVEGTGRGQSWGALGWHKALPHVDIEGGPAEYLRIYAPSLVQAGQPFAVQVAVTDAFDDAAYPFYQGEVQVHNPETFAGLPARLMYRSTDRGTRRVEAVRIGQPGLYRIRMRLAGSSKVFESNPVVVRKKVDEPIYWGQLHNHDWYSECWGDGLANFYWFGRDISGLDFLALSDHALLPRKDGFAGRLYAARHGRPISSYDSFMNTIAMANKYDEPGRFATLVGYEWSSEQSGHHNIYLADVNPENFGSIFSKQPVYVDFVHELRAILSKTDALLIPHVSASYFPWGEFEVGRTRSGEPLSPVVETYSDWGFGYYSASEHVNAGMLGQMSQQPGATGLREAIARFGLMVGLTSDSDCHVGLPGRRYPSIFCGGGHDRPQGLTALRVPNLTRKDIVRAIRRRATYGTSGARMFLDVRVGRTEMGQVLRTDAPTNLELEVAGTDFLKEINIYGGVDRLARFQPNRTREGKWAVALTPPPVALKPYFVEVVQADENRAWASPIWLGRASAPDLAWRKDERRRLWLVNEGTAPARNVRVLHGDRETPFVDLAIAPKRNGTETKGGLIWTQARSDRTLTVHFRWTGKPLTGRATIAGQEAYRMEPGLRGLWFSTFKDNGAGTVEFDGRKGPNDRSVRPGPPKAEGFDLTITAKPEQPCKVTYVFDRAIPVWVGEQLKQGRRLEIELNHFRSPKGLRWFTIDELAPGGRWRAPTAAGCWSADTPDALAELREDNNWIGPQAESGRHNTERMHR